MATKPGEQSVGQRLRSLMAGAIPYVFPLRPVVEDDRITYHKHWFVLMRTVFVPTLFMAVSSAVALGVAATQFRAGSEIVSISGVAIWVFSVLWLLWRYDNWRNDFYVVAKDRIIDVYRLPLGMRTEVREAPLSNIQNLSLRIPNFVAAFFDYGDVMIDTAGKQGQLVFRSVRRPREVMAEVSARVDGFRLQKAAREKEQRDREMLQWFSAYADLGRIVVLRNPHTVIAGECVEVEWRVAGPPAKVETALQWDSRPRPERDFAFRTDLQAGGVGNYIARFSPPPGKAYFVVVAQIDSQTYYSVVHEVRVQPAAPD